MPWGRRGAGHGCSRRWPSCWYSPARPGSRSAPRPRRPGPLRLRRRPDHPVRARAGRHPRGRQGDRRQGPRVPGHRPGGQAGGAAGRGRPACRPLVRVPGLGPAKAPAGPRAARGVLARGAGRGGRRRQGSRPAPGWAPAPRPTAPRLEPVGPAHGRHPPGRWPPLAETLRDRLAGVAEVERVEVAGSLQRMKGAVHDIPTCWPRPTAGRGGPRLHRAAPGGRGRGRRRHQGLHPDPGRPPGRPPQSAPRSGGRPASTSPGRRPTTSASASWPSRPASSSTSTASSSGAASWSWPRTRRSSMTAWGMAWVPPVLREDRGEVDAARRGRLPALVALEDVGGDFLPTDLSPDGTAPWRRWWTRPGPRLPVPGHHRPRRAAGARPGPAATNCWPSASCIRALEDPAWATSPCCTGPS